MKGTDVKSTDRGNHDRQYHGNRNGNRQEGYEQALKKPTRTIICSSPYTKRAAESIIAFDKLMGRIQDDYANGYINGAQFNQAGQRADSLIRSFESEINNIRNQFRQRSRPNRPQQKPPKVHQGAPNGANGQNGTLVVKAVAPKQTTQLSSATIPSKSEVTTAKSSRTKKKVVAA